MEILKITTIVIICFLLLFVITTITFLASEYIEQTIEKNTWGSFKYRITTDSAWYLTNEYKINENGCIDFTDNYGQDKTWCEKFSIGEYYLHENRPNLKTIWFGY